MSSTSRTDSTPPDFAAFLARQLPRQRKPIAPYQLAGAQVWLKRAGPGNSAWRYRLLGAAARLLRLPALRPVPNPGGNAAIATEVRRLRQLAGAGLRVPQVLAAQADGMLLLHLGTAGRPTPSLANEMRDAVPGGAQAVLALWRLGLQALDTAHGHSLCLSQAFARNMVRCPDGVVACIDFEDDPAAALPPVLCQVRDALCYAHSSAYHLAQAGALPEARALWRQWCAGAARAPGFGAELERAVRRLAWLRRLPRGPRWGRDVQRLHAAFDLLD